MKKRLNVRLTAYLMLTVAVSMVITTVFVLCGTTSAYLKEFRGDAEQVFSTDFLAALNDAAQSDSAAASQALLESIQGTGSALQLGNGRDLSILSADGNYLAGTNDEFGAQMEQDGNILRAMRGEVGDKLSMFGGELDIVLPVSGDGTYLVVVTDHRDALRAQCKTIASMLFGAFVCSVLGALAFGWMLMKTVTVPVERMLVRVRNLQKGIGTQSGQTVYAPDELGQLAQALDGAAPQIARITEDALQETAPFTPIVQPPIHSTAVGLITLALDGEILAMDTQAERLTGTLFRPGMQLEELFAGTPVPDSTETLLHASTLRNGRMLDIQFEKDGAERLTLVVRAAEGLTV